jgi:tetratricopeptide (TPR) repeat protein
MGLKQIATLFCLAVAMLLAAPQAHAQAWRRAESENFIVYSRSSERSLRDTVQELELFNGVLHDLTGAARPETPVKLSVYLLQDPVALHVVWPSAAPDIAGFYIYQPESVAAFLVHDDMGWRGGAQQVLFHEYTHHFMMQYFSAAYPAWYVEGFAEYLATVQFRGGRTTVGRPGGMRQYQLVEGGPDALLPTEVMLGPVPADTQARGQFYAQSWLMVHYMFSTPERQRALNAYMSGLGNGADPIVSFEPSFGVSLEEFRNVLATYMRGDIPFTIYQNRELEDAAMVVTRMPRSADNLLLLNARLVRTQAPDDLVDGIVGEAGRFPGDAFATRSAALAELSRNPARARELATPLIEADPQDFEAQYIVGRSYFAEAEAAADGGETAMAQARRHFVRAFRANPQHVPTLYYYVRAQENQEVTEELIDVLIQAHLLAPQVAEIRLNLAIQLLNAQRFEEAALLLGPIAYNPHGGDAAGAARHYLEIAQRNQTAQD